MNRCVMSIERHCFRAGGNVPDTNGAVYWSESAVETEIPAAAERSRRPGRELQRANAAFGVIPKKAANFLFRVHIDDAHPRILIAEHAPFAVVGNGNRVGTSFPTTVDGARALRGDVPRAH